MSPRLLQLLLGFGLFHLIVFLNFDFCDRTSENVVLGDESLHIYAVFFREANVEARQILDLELFFRQ